MSTVKGMFSLSGLLAFILGVLLSVWVKSTAASVTSNTGG